MREFALVDGNGEEYNLTVEDSFLHDPSGLGFEHENTYRQVGTRFIKVNTRSNQSVISGKVHFHPDDAYEEYQNFVEFSGRDGLELKYRLAEIPARSIKTKSKEVVWNDISTDLFDGEYDFIDGAYAFKHLLIECDGTETVTTKVSDSKYTIFGIQGLSYDRNIDAPVYCNGLPPIIISSTPITPATYDFDYGCGTLTGGNTDEIVIVLTTEALNGKTITQWLTDNKPQFYYTLDSDETGTYSSAIFDPEVMYNPVIEGFKKKGIEKDPNSVDIRYVDANSNNVHETGEKIELENTVFGQHLDSIKIGTEINGTNANSYFKKTSCLVSKFNDLNWSSGDENYIYKPDQSTYLGPFWYGKNYKLSANFKAEHDITRAKATNTINIKIATNGFAGLNPVDSVRVKLSLIMQDKPGLVETSNQIELFSIEDRIYSPSELNHPFVLYEKIGDDNEVHNLLSVAFDQDVIDKQFNFVGQDGTQFNCYFALKFQVTQDAYQYLEETHYYDIVSIRSDEVKSTNEIPQVKQALVGVPIANTTKTYILDRVYPEYCAMQPGGGGSFIDTPDALWTEAFYNTYKGQLPEHNNHELQNSVYYMTELGSDTTHKTAYNSASLVKVSSTGEVKKYPYSPAVVEEIHNMYRDDLALVKLYDSESHNYKRRVEIKKVDKTELDKTASLECNVDFECLEPWIDPVTSFVEHEPDEVNIIRITSDSHTLSPCTLYIDGPAKTPTWTQTINGEVIAIGKYNADIADGETLVIHTKQGENGIYILATDSVSDAYQNSDFNTDRFMFIRYGENEFRVFGYEYVVTSDESFEEGKTYYELTSSDPDVYTVTSDATMVSGKTYYEYVGDVELDCRIEGELYYESV